MTFANTSDDLFFFISHGLTNSEMMRCYKHGERIDSPEAQCWLKTSLVCSKTADRARCERCVYEKQCAFSLFKE